MQNIYLLMGNKVILIIAFGKQKRFSIFMDLNCKIKLEIP